MKGRTVVGGCALVLAACASEAPEATRLAAAALRVEAELVDFGPVAPGDLVTRTVELRNEGEVALGLDDIVLEDARGAFDLAVGCEPWPGREGGCVLPPGASASMAVSFATAAPGRYRAAVRLSTTGDGSDEPDGIFPDRRRPWQQIGLTAQVHGEDLPPVVLPPEVDLGWVEPTGSASTPLTILNPNTHAMTVQAVAASDCDPGFRVEVDPDAAWVLPPQGHLGARVIFEASADAPATCSVVVTTRGLTPDAPERATEVRAVANQESPRRCFGVEILEPKPGTRIDGDTVRMRVAFDRCGAPLDDIFCKVRSWRQGEADGGPTLADCSDIEEGVAELDVPTTFYVESGPEVFLVDATDPRGSNARATVPVLLGTDPAADDADRDGYGTDSEPRDCDDTQVRAHPWAVEAADGIDNDCDRLTDEGTTGFDDDGDGVSEAERDCDDADPEVYPGAPERRDRRDNDCDGLVDEGTSAFDDDGDGYTELERDCDDGDAAVGPDRVEICGDGIDNDCDRLLDDGDPDGCVTLDSVAPALVGTVYPDAAVVEVGEEIEIRAYVDVPDGVDPGELVWAVGSGEAVSAEGPALTWRAPRQLQLEDAPTLVDVVVQAVDADGDGPWAGELLEVVPEGSLRTELVFETEAVRAGCSSLGGGAVGLGLAWLGLLLVRRRRG